MGSAVTVDAAAMAEEAAGLARAGRQVEDVGEACRHALQLVAAAGGGGTLSAAASSAATEWGQGLALVAQRGRSLALATQEASAAYLRVEGMQTAIWAARATGWSTR